MANNGKLRSPRQTKGCMWCGNLMKQKITEGKQYFAIKKYCCQRCNSFAREAKLKEGTLEGLAKKEKDSNKSALMFRRLAK